MTPKTTSAMLVFLLLNNTVIVQWLPNRESDLAGYKVYYGTASRSYSNSIPAGLATQWTISNLQPGFEYYFAVTAYDTAGNESRYSNEVSIFITGDGETPTSEDPENVYNFPNPFNPETQDTQIRYYLVKSETVAITIFDVGGNKIKTILKDVPKSAGEHTEDRWDGRDENGKLVPNGIYYAYLSAESLNQYVTIAVNR